MPSALTALQAIAERYAAENLDHFEDGPGRGAAAHARVEDHAERADRQGTPARIEATRMQAGGAGRGPRYAIWSIAVARWAGAGKGAPYFSAIPVRSRTRAAYDGFTARQEPRRSSDLRRKPCKSSKTRCTRSRRTIRRATPPSRARCCSSTRSTASPGA